MRKNMGTSDRVIRKPMKLTGTNLSIAFGLVAIGIAIAVAGIYIGDTDDAPGAALLGILLMIGAVTLAVRIARRNTDASILQKAFTQAVTKAELTKRTTCHTLRHSLATPLIEAGYDIRTVQELLGHKDVRTTMLYAHVLNRGARGVKSPVDGL